MPLLEIRTKQSQKRLELSGKPVSIGRSPENTLVLTDSRSSREHCIIELVDDRWSVRDLKSRNGTQLNDESISRPERLANGDDIMKGPTIGAIRTLARNGLFTTLEEFGFDLVAQGETPFEEIDRVAGSE